MTEAQFPPENFQREDEGDDGQFYAFPRFVVHIDDQAIASVSRVFQHTIPENAVILDLMSSWRSHWPESHPKNKLVGLGLNADEMRDNPNLDDYVVHNLNKDPGLPFDDASFDAVVITVSAQYLTRPVETYRQINRVLQPGGLLLITFSNRMFPTKAVRIWRVSSDAGRMQLVTAYLEAAGNFEDIRSGLVNQDSSPPGDPIYLVMCRKTLDPA